MLPRTARLVSEDVCPLKPFREADLIRVIGEIFPE
jgi:hypothetical protein